ncbi:MAG: penicillin-binding protein 2, partial [Phycisphaerales bacterium]
GVGLTPKLLRHYPQGALAAALVGLVGFEHTGLAGMEHQYDAQLEPEHGRLRYLRDARRKTLWIEPSDYTPGHNGSNVRLSIDLVIQDIAERRLREAVTAQNAGGGRIMVIDPRSGEVLALSDILYTRPGWDEQTDDPFREQDPALGRNRCATDPYEPGSTFKPFVWSVATELGKATLDEVLPTPAHTGHRTSTGRLIREAYFYGPSSWRKVLIKSINAGMAIVAERMTEAQMQDVITRFGFGHRTHCGLPGETMGIVTSPKDWTTYTQCSVAMGHEIAVTPVQMVRAFSAFARDGTLPTLRITALSRDEAPYQVVQRAISPATARTTREVLREVMIEGTGRKAQSELYELFGKSGTAQLPKKNGGGYHEDRYVSSFIAGAPLRDPQIVVLCVIDDPDKSKGYHGGGTIAGPVVRDVIDAALTYLGVPPEKPQRDENALASAL